MDIAAAGEEVLISLYNGKQGEQLDSLHYKRFFEKVATNVSHVHPQTLPPTSVLQSITAFVSIFRYRNGRVISLIC